MSNEGLKLECVLVRNNFVKALRDNDLAKPKAIEEFTAFTTKCLEEISDTKEWSEKISAGSANRRFLKEFKKHISESKKLILDEGLVYKVDFGSPTLEKADKKNVTEFLELMKAYIEATKEEQFNAVGASSGRSAGSAMSH